MAKRDTGVAPRYEEIAVDLARKILERELPETERIHGRSSLAAHYKVSPETIRRAIAILHDRGIVQVTPGSGIRVASRVMAREFLDGLRTRSEIEDLQQQLSELVTNRTTIDQRVHEITLRLSQLASRALETSRRLEELAIPPESWLVGESLASARLRNLTGITVIGVVRGPEEHYSPPPDFTLAAGDMLMVMGQEDARRRAQQVITLTERPGGGAVAGK